MQKVVNVNQIYKSYAKSAVKALQNVTFEVNKGELFGFICPDGAGKTSLFRILATLLKPDMGEAFLEGFDCIKDYKKIRNIIGYMPGRFSLYQDLTVEENLTFFATIFGTSIQQNYHLIKDIYNQIEPFRKRPAGKLSGGMKQKLALSCAMVHEPKILILDEPTTGVDAVSRIEFWDMLQNLNNRGITIIVATPYMDEASLCDRIALIQNAEILAIDAPKAITKSFAKKIFAIQTNKPQQLIKDLKIFPNCDSAFNFGNCVHFTFKTETENKNELFRFLHNQQHENIHIAETEPNIEDCFMQLISKNQNI